MPEQVSSYRLEAEIARGGMGIVYRAVHTVFDEVVAIKAVFPELTVDPEMRERFLNEAKIQRRLQHPNIVQIREFLIDQGKSYIVMEFVAGETLSNRLRQLGRPMRAYEAIEVFRQALEGLGFAHSQGVIHRDIKPSNIMLTLDGVAKLTDFGIARGPRQRQLDPHRHGARHARLHVTGTDSGQKARLPHRHLFHGRHALQDARRARALPGSRGFRERVRRHHRAREREAHPAQPLGARYLSVLEAAILKALRKPPEERFPVVPGVPSRNRFRRRSRGTDGAGGGGAQARERHQSSAARGTSSSAAAVSGGSEAARAESRRRAGTSRGHAQDFAIRAAERGGRRGSAHGAGDDRSPPAPHGAAGQQPVHGFHSRDRDDGPAGCALSRAGCEPNSTLFAYPIAGRRTGIDTGAGGDARARRHSAGAWNHGAGACDPQPEIRQHTQRAAEYLRSRQYADAESEYRAASQLDPQNSDLHVSLGMTLGLQGNFEGQAAEDREALRLNPNNDHAHLGLGSALSRQNDREGAMAEYREAIRLNPANEGAHLSLGIQYSQMRDWDGAIAEYSEVVRLRPNNYSVHYSLGMAYEHKGDRQAALQEYRTAYEMNPNVPAYKQAYDRLSAQ